eukprot:3837493-Ditylum_brightwellii.AAC.1
MSHQTNLSMNRLYVGNENLSAFVQQHIAWQDKRDRQKTGNDRKEITAEKLKRVWRTKYCSGRLCRDLEIFQKHVTSKRNRKSTKSCNA